MKYLFISFIAALLIFCGCDGAKSEDESEEMVLYVSLQVKIRGMDPMSMRDVYSMSVASQMYETLFQYHYLKRPYEIVPMLADGMPDISEDRCTYVIKIKKGIYFQDDECFERGKGRELKAEDFVYSIKRIANIKNLSQNWSLFDDKIVGLDEFREYTKTCKRREDVDYSREAEGLKAIDDYTLLIKLKRPWPQLLSTCLADLATSAVPKEAVDHYGKDIINSPVGTGAFMLKEWNRGSFVELVRNPNFREKYYPSEGEPGDKEAGYLNDAGKRVPLADRVIWVIIEEYQPMWFLFMQGKLDVSVIPKDNFDQALTPQMELTPEMEARGIELKKYIRPSTFWLGFNMLDPVLGNNKPLRKAISRGIDREKFIEIFFNGRDVVAHGVVALLMDSHDPNINRYGFSKYDPNEAKELLKKAEEIHGGKIGTLRLAVPGTDTFSRQMGLFIKNQFTRIGLDLELEFSDWPTYQEKLNKRGHQIFFSGAAASIPDGIDFLQMFYSKYWAPGSNRFNYKSDKFDELYEKVEVMGSSPERVELYRQAELIALEDYPAAFINHRVSYILHHGWYKNYKPHVFQYGLAKYRRIELEKRKAYKELLKKVK